MRKFTLTEWFILTAIAAIVLSILIPGIQSIRKGKTQDQVVRDALTSQPELPALIKDTAWTYLGTASDGVWHGSVLRAKDPDTGATIYVLLGGERGGIFVLPAPEKAK